MPVSKYRVRSTCLSCNRRISGPTVAVVTTVREDGHQPKAYLVHEDCHSALRGLTAHQWEWCLQRVQGPLRRSCTVSRSKPRQHCKV